MGKFPSLESCPVGDVGLATLLCGSINKERGLDRSCLVVVDASNSSQNPFTADLIKTRRNSQYFATCLYYGAAS
jgi:hypothetical protein